MLITDKFVLINFPKTGSTFARDAIKLLWKEKETRLEKVLTPLGLIKQSICEYQMPKIDEFYHYGIKDQHGTYRQVPLKHKNKPVISVVRNPFSLLLSNYFFEWWVEHPQAEINSVKAVFKNFPDLSFAEYYHMSHLFSRKNRLKDIIPHYEIGAISVQFIQFYKHCPDAYILSLDDNYFENHDLKEDFNHIRFIHQENLVEELSTVLKEFGFQTRDVDFLKEIPKINVTRLKQKFNNRQVKWFSQELIQNVLERDRLIFHLFPEYLPGAPAPFGFNQ